MISAVRTRMSLPWLVRMVNSKGLPPFARMPFGVGLPAGLSQ